MDDSTNPSPSAPHPLEVFAGFLQGVAQLVTATAAVANEVYTRRLVEAGQQVDSPPPSSTSNIIPPDVKTFGTKLGNFLFGFHAAVTEFADGPTARWIAQVKMNADAHGESVHDYVKHESVHYGCRLAVRGMHEEKNFGAVEVLARSALSLDLRQGDSFRLGSALVEKPWQAERDPAKKLRNFVLRARNHPTEDPGSHEYGMRPPRLPSLGMTAQFIPREAGASNQENEEASDALQPGDIAEPLTEHRIAQDEQLEQVRAAMKKKLTPQAYSLWEEHQQDCSYSEAARRLGMSNKERERYRREITRKTKPVHKRVRNSTR
ncbi:hypothetical protein [Corallococcus carmarthensis]|uniref:Uncharacterized protein n=1 Tax=Corallococcus carmarthensis TaxID=2316728 RepID=A0A3A8JQU0_9BACT|nr:hypothetical protein [Corallococcus carmarthensis]RKG98099.1 hypothetical protein D7X32_30690 [Corallococcus carmarthensis]